jgi:tetratricopeptide (TPR) repeat protein
MSLRRSLLSLIALALVCTSISAYADECEQAKSLWTKGLYPEAEKEALACLAKKPDSVATWFLLSRIFAAQYRYNEALIWVDTGLEKHPEDVDLLAWRVRVLAWKGDLDRAWDEALNLPSVAFLDPDTSKLVADLAYWRKDYPIAVRRYKSHLDKWPDDKKARQNRAVSKIELGHVDEGETELRELCDQDSSNKSACGQVKEIEKRRTRYWLGLQPGIMVSGKEIFGWNVMGNFGWKINPAWTAEALVDFRRRELGTEYNTDIYIEGAATWRFLKRYALRAAVGGTVIADYSPWLTFQIEPSVRFYSGVELFLKYWRMQFKDAGINILSPRLSYYAGPFFLDMRYYLSITDDGDIGNAVLGKLMAFIVNFHLYGGAGIGDRTDYIYQQVDKAQTDRFWTLMGGAGWRFGWRNLITFDYVYRNEKAAQTMLHIHQLMLGYRVDF